MGFLSQVKYKLSHVSASAWHWKAVEFIWGDRAGGKACTYYWIKIPTSLIALAFVVIVGGIWFLGRVAMVSVMWVLGFRFRGRLTDFDQSVDRSYNYNDYKIRGDGTKNRFAPWEFLAVILGVFVVVKFPSFAVQIGLVAVALMILGGLVYLVSKAVKIPRIARLRKEIENAWDGICPPLYVEPKPSVHTDTDGSE